MTTKKLSRQQKILLEYLSEGGWMSTYQIARLFLDEYDAIWFDVRTRAGELRRRGLVEFKEPQTVPAQYKITQEGREALKETTKVKVEKFISPREAEISMGYVEGTGELLSMSDLKQLTLL